MRVGFKNIRHYLDAMPVRLASQSLDSVGPYNRLSASQVNAYRSCPRLWFYEKVRRFKMPQIPVLFVGRAVEEAVCRMLMESPALLVANASSDTLSAIPLDEGGIPSRTSLDPWPAERLLALPEQMWPADMERLRDWGIGRLKKHLHLALNAMKAEWEKDERKAGKWSSVDPDYCLKMCINALDFHLKEVQRCLEHKGGPGLKEWRRGNRPEWPSPDARRYTLSNNHPLSQNGEVSLIEAWEITRPWFVDPNAAKFAMNAVHPEHWFQGEYDLVYRWDGRINIVDLKASVGKGDRSGNYVQQLRMYAMLWWITHEKEQTVDALEIWYLGANSIKSIPCPTVEEMAEMESELETLWHELREITPSIDDCPPSPSPVRGFKAGGIAIEPPNESRCISCDWEQICPGGQGDDDLPEGGSVQLPGSSNSFDITPIGELDPRMTLIGEVFTVLNAREGRRPQITISQGNAFAKVVLLVDHHQDGQPSWPEDISKGDSVKLDNVIPSANWKGEIELKVDPHACIVPALKDEVASDLMEFRARWNVSGRLIYRFSKSGVGRNGKQWHRKGAMILDSTGAMKVEGWANDWGPQYDLAEIGDTVVVANIGLDAWAVEIRGDVSRNSKFHISKRIQRD